MKSRPVSGILFPPKWAATIPLGPPLPTASCSLPGSIERATRSLLGLAPRGACRATTVTRRAGGLLPHRSTLARTARGVGVVLNPRARPLAVCFLWRFPRVAPGGRYPPRCPMESRLSSTVSRRGRPACSSTTSLAASFLRIESDIHQFIGANILLPADVLVRHPLELPRGLDDLLVEQLQGRVLHLVSPLQLLDQKL
jgi:hypothetical protein